ncbi:hypothetical protein BD410DRAFT_847213 [Rickenella mellea]|uniref:Peptidase C14 caspase domain-containing protein n=1 Tax=Rickenella mellea TaxID=50990 RepID=A0A4V3AZF8_9AGAM|nr:hypothetical protein BD410DRAFT_847213 [Rickenella mellea]
MKAINWLVHDASPRDRLFFHFSGHSRQVEDVDGDERDGRDEAIVPVDGGYILDDTCYSGSTLDLPYVHCSDGTRGKPIPVPDKMPVQNYAPFNSAGAASSDSTSCAREPHPVWESRFSNARVVYFGACKDKEQSQEGNDQNGALTDAFLKSMEKNPNQTYLELLRSIR